MIEGIKGGPPPLRGSLRARAPGAGFHLPASRPEAPPPGAALGGAGLIGLQQGWTPAEQDDAAGRRGRALLEELARLQRDMLRGRLDPAGLSRLAAMSEGEGGHDPELREIVAAIGLRARVELARIGR